MKPLRFILVIGLALFSVIRLAMTCQKRDAESEARKKQNEFALMKNAINAEREDIFRFDKDDKDSLVWMAAQTKSFSRVLDSCITYYRDNYNKDEKRYKNYLGVLYEYKKLLYVYQDWIKYNKEKAPLEKNKEKIPIQYAGYMRQVRSIFAEIQHKELWANFEL